MDFQKFWKSTTVKWILRRRWAKIAITGWFTMFWTEGPKTGPKTTWRFAPTRRLSSSTTWWRSWSGGRARSVWRRSYRLRTPRWYSASSHVCALVCRTCPGSRCISCTLWATLRGSYPVRGRFRSRHAVCPSLWRTNLCKRFGKFTRRSS